MESRKEIGTNPRSKRKSRLTRDEISHLENMNSDVLFEIIMRLEPEDIFMLCSTSKKIRTDICQDTEETIWRSLWKRDISRVAKPNPNESVQKQYRRALQLSLPEIIANGYDILAIKYIEDDPSSVTSDLVYTAGLIGQKRILKKLLSILKDPLGDAIVAAGAGGYQQLAEELAEGSSREDPEIYLIVGDLLNNDESYVIQLRRNLQNAFDNDDADSAEVIQNYIDSIYNLMVEYGLLLGLNERVGTLLDGGFLYPSPNIRHNIFLHIAQMGDLNLLALLISHEVDPNVGFRPEVPIESLVFLHETGQIDPETRQNLFLNTVDNPNLFKQYIEAGLDPDQIALGVAINDGNLDLVKFLVERGYPVDKEYINVIIEGIDPGEMDPETRLHNVIRYLLEHLPSDVDLQKILADAGFYRNAFLARELLHRGVPFDENVIDMIRTEYWSELDPIYRLPYQERSIAFLRGVVRDYENERGDSDVE